MSDYRHKAEDEMFCSSCSEIIKKEAEICPKCGVRLKMPTNSVYENWLTLFLLSILLGSLGVDRFYVGKIGTGIAKLLTAGGCGIWWMIDWILILNGKFKDKDGNYIKRN